MKAVVTGGAGFIGSHLVEALLSQKLHVRVVDNFSTSTGENLGSCRNDIELVEGDVAEEKIAELACHDADFIFHLAAIPSVPASIAEPLKTQQSGEVATLNLLHAAARSGVRRFIFASSCSVYGDSAILPISESASIHPCSPYAASKAASEAYLQAFSAMGPMDTVAFRYFNVYGVRQGASSDYSGAIARFASRMIKGETPVIYGDGEQTRDFVNVADVVVASLIAMQSTRRFAGSCINIGSGKRTSLKLIVEVINEILGTSYQPSHEPAREGDIRHSQADTARAIELLGFTAKVSLATGLRALIEDLRKS